MGYRHTQRAPLHWLIAVPGAVLIASAWFASDPVWVRVLLGVGGGLMLLLSLCFQELTVEDAGDALCLRFGPIPWFRRTIPYARVRSVAAARSVLLDGWGIHYTAGRGWIWNLWGFDCAALELDKGRLRIGSNDLAHLIRFLEARIAKERA